ncbi:MAG TPA: gluconate 2-dehydrogenase subunit 3 family protein, partial [Chthoniobacteraceae bacterium]
MRIQFPSISRREAIQRIAAAATALSLLRSRGLAADGPRAIGSDPDLRKKIIPWEKVLTDEELKTVTALCDLIIPADEKSPAASAVG